MKDLCKKRKREAIFEDIYCIYSIFLFVASIVGLALIIFSSIPKWIITVVIIALILIRVVLYKINRVKGKGPLERIFTTNYKLGCLTSDYFRHVIEAYEDGKYKSKVWCEAYPCINISIPIRVDIFVRYLPCDEAEAFKIKDKLEEEAKKLQDSFSEIVKAKVSVKFVPYQN